MPNSRILVQSIFLVAMSVTTVVPGQDTLKDHAILPESYLRQTVRNPVMPIFPDEAIKKNISGLIRVRIEISSRGEVLRIKVKPGTNRILAQAVVDAVKEWQFHPFRGSEGDTPSIGRLSFSFALSEDRSSVEFYDPPLDAPDSERLGYCHSLKDALEWRTWEEIPFFRKMKE